MSTELTKKQVRDALELKTDAALADWFEVSRAAVAQWPEEEPLPRLRQLEARQRRPDLWPAQHVEHDTPRSERAA